MSPRLSITVQDGPTIELPVDLEGLDPETLLAVNRSLENVRELLLDQQCRCLDALRFHQLTRDLPMPVLDADLADPDDLGGRGYL